MFTAIFWLVLLAIVVKGVIEVFRYSQKYEEYTNSKYERRFRSPEESTTLLPPTLWGIEKAAIWLVSWITFDIFIGIFASISTDGWWFSSIGRNDVFMTTEIWRRVFVIGLTLSLTGFYTWFLHWQLPTTKKLLRIGYWAGGFILAWLTSLHASSFWNELVLYTHQVPSAITDPHFHKSVNFYLFDLSVFSSIANMIMVACSICFLITLLVATIQNVRKDERITGAFATYLPKSFYVLGALLFGVLAYGSQLAIYGLLTESHHLITGITYISEHVDIPALRAQQVIYLVIAGILLAYPWVKQKGVFFDKLTLATGGLLLATFLLPPMLGGFQTIWLIIALLGAALGGLYIYLMKKKWNVKDEVYVPITLVVIILCTWVFNGWIAPSVMHNVYVRPKEIQMESPYIAKNIAMTRQAFALTDRYLSEETRPYSDTLTREMLLRNKSTIDNIRILDFDATLAVFNNQHSVKPYYHFEDIDYDRYPRIDSVLGMYFLGAREMFQDGLPSKSYLNTHYIYGHGFGWVKSPADSFDHNTGYPIYTTSGFQLSGEPRIYYQEKSSNDFFYVKTDQPEIDHPTDNDTSDAAVYTYTGNGGIELNTFARKLGFGLRYDWRLLFGGTSINDTSRIMIRRTVHDIVTTVAPWFLWDKDAQFVTLSNGKNVWIVNGFSVSSRYPYATSYDESTWDTGDGLDQSYNYIRHSVKAVINAFDGETVFYSFNEDDDPIVSTVMHVFPKMFMPLDSMSSELRRHLLYPIRYFKAQAGMYTRYHIKRPHDFFAQDNMLRIAYEQYRENKEKMAPRHLFMKAPGEQKERFLITTPFTPKEKSETETRDYMTSWMMGMSDPDAFLKLRVISYPRERAIVGPWMVESQIMNQTEIKASYNLWHAWQGSLMVIPIENTIIYVEPAIMSNQNNLPGIKMIAACHNTHVAWGRTVEEALLNLTLRNVPKPVASFPREVASIYDDYQVTIPIMDGNGNITSQTVSASGKENAFAILRQAIEQIESAVLMLKQAEQDINNGKK